MELFLRKNKNLAYIKDKEGMSALHLSAGNGRNPTISVLINECPDICELLDNRERTALHIAVETGYFTVVNNLLCRRVFSDLINEKDVDGNTALHVAAIHGRYRILKKLANEKRVDKDAINKAGMTVIDIIQSSSQIAKDKKVSLITMLKRNGSQPSLERRALMLERMLEQIDGLKKFEMTPETELKAAAGSTDSVAITSTTTGNEGKKAEKRVRRYNKWSPELVKNLANINLLVATIIASITFSAAIAVPGGFDSIDGIAILRRKTSFRFFLAFDSLAFGCSTASMSIHFLVTFTSRIIHETYAYPITGVLLLTLLSIASTVFAYIAGTNAVLNHHSSFGLSATIACTSFIVPVSFFLVRLVVVLHKRDRALVVATFLIMSFAISD
ncbi:hypothetical protein TIFTF001_030031 [Ficus carica]|uniref:PGG domain-containing protein n=1 Tax=Ficus carica TaxID=3494 RepID=A0AA88J366_FICCA|nr:hypothetical protein TIFTF001_030031 [Ficus carica]